MTRVTGESEVDLLTRRVQLRTKRLSLTVYVFVFVYVCMDVLIWWMWFLGSFDGAFERFVAVFAQGRVRQFNPLMTWMLSRRERERERERVSDTLEGTI